MDDKSRYQRSTFRPSPKNVKRVEGSYIADSEKVITSLSQRLASVDWQKKEVPLYQLGDQIDDKYIVTDRFSGRFGNVYISELSSGSLFAIKQPIKEILEQPGMPALIFKEAVHWNVLGLHPDVAYCYFVKLIDDVPYIFIEYMDGGTWEAYDSPHKLYVRVP